MFPNSTEWQFHSLTQAGALQAQAWEEAGQDHSFSESLIWVSSCPCAPLSCGDDLSCLSHDGPSSNLAKFCLVSPLCVWASPRHADEIYHTTKHVSLQSAILEMQRLCTSFLSSNTQIKSATSHLFLKISCDDQSPSSASVGNHHILLTTVIDD